jgi:hypothetical protein
LLFLLSIIVACRHLTSVAFKLITWLILGLRDAVSILSDTHTSLAHHELAAVNALFDQTPFAIRV